MAILQKFMKGESIFSSSFREKLNAIVDFINRWQLSFRAKSIPEDSSSVESSEIWIKIDGYSDGENRTWLYDWTQVFPGLEDPNIWYENPFPMTQDTWWNEEEGIKMGQAINGMEYEEGGPTVQRPIRVGSVVRAKVEFVSGTEDPPLLHPQIRFYASNNERQFFARITGFSSGYYSWEECFANGDTIDGEDSPQSGNHAVNSYYGTADLTHVVSTGKIVLMSYLPSNIDEELVGFTLPLEGDAKNVSGDGMGYPAPASLDVAYPPPDGLGSPTLIGGAGSWIEVWEIDDPENPGERIRRIYHQTASTPATGEEFNTASMETTDGGDPDGGNAGMIEFEDVLVEPDATGHIAQSNPEEDASTILAGDHIVINGSSKIATIKHSKPGTAVTTYNIEVASVAGGSGISLPSLPFDALGHWVNSESEGITVAFIGDDWIDFAPGDPGEIEVTHQPAQSDGSLMVGDPEVVITAGSAGGGGDVQANFFNPNVDTTGHTNVGLSQSYSLKLTAMAPLKIAGTGGDATIEIVAATAGSPASIGDVFVGGSMAVVGTNIVFTPRVKPIMVTKDSDGFVTDVTLGTETDGTDITLECGEC